jgi:phosphoserine phosphatase RsbU/P
MKILVADDDDSIRKMLTTMLTENDYVVVAVSNGEQAWEVMAQENAPPVGILDWNMPAMTGPEVIRRVRSVPRPYAPYLLLLTAKDRRGDIVEGLQAGASDYITKPFDCDELLARLQVGARMVNFQMELGQRVRDLEEALDHVRHLQGLLPICSYCKKVRDDQNYWHAVDNYLAVNSDMHFSHGICPDCYQKVAVPQMEMLRRNQGGSE